ncbi:hypothetical protein F5X97DRAFT_280886 [Nemania serpens]|nr:hypothetical protein F5X97DRAFT_280886 [Nemania serpens]
MVIEIQHTQVLSPREACPIQNYASSMYSCISTQLDSTKLTRVPIPSLPSSVINMKAFPQRPSPASSQAIKKRPSLPHLGDGLLTAFTCNATLTESTIYTNPDVSATLTSSSLNQLAKSTHHDGDLILVGTPSTCSDDDDLLIGRRNWAINSKSSSRLSSRFSTSGGDETLPTALTGDDSSFSSNEENALDSLPSSHVDSKTIFSTETTSFPPSASRGTTERVECQSHITTSISKNLRAPYYTCPVNKLSELRESASVHKSAETIRNGEITPTVEYLHGIVRSFLATETKAKSPFPLMTEPHQYSVRTPTPAGIAKQLWEPQGILEHHLKGEITAEEAKETAQRYSFPGVLPIIDGTGELKKNSPLQVSNNITDAASKGNLGVICQPTGFSAEAFEREQYEKIHEAFRLKLATYSAKDGYAGGVKPLHIFVDMSNIHIGFCNSWKISQNIPVDRRVRAPVFNFKVLASIMERNRPAKKKVLASSVASHVVSRTQWPQHFVDAEKQGYKTSILSRVQKASPIKARRRHKTSTQTPGVIHPSSVVTSGDESAEDLGRACYQTRNGEQGVDEILHLNMMNSILDDMQEPGSMVLATGDAAQAEFSEGFLEYATRALSQGWNLELVTWKTTISSAWMKPVFRDKYGERFRVIYLDEFIEELNADKYSLLV